MNSRKERIEAEALALWRELYDEPAPLQAGGGEMLDLMLNRLPDVPYQRLASPYLGRGQMAWPKAR